MFLMKILTSRIGLIGVTLSIAMSWHYIDKANAVRSAQEELADDVTIRTLEAEIEASRLSAAVSKAASARLQGKIADARARDTQYQTELEEYENTTNVNDSCVVDKYVLERLHNN